MSHNEEFCWNQVILQEDMNDIISSLIIFVVALFAVCSSQFDLSECLKNKVSCFSDLCIVRGSKKRKIREILENK